MTESLQEITPRQKLREQGMQMLRDGKAPSEVTRALGVPIQTTSSWKRRLGIETPQLRPSRKGILLPRRPPRFAQDVVPASPLALPAHLSRGAKIKRARTMRGLRMGDVARCAGVHKGTLSRIERNDPSVHATMLQKVAVALGVPMTDLVVPPSHPWLLHEQVRHARLTQGLSRQAVADRAGVTYPTIRNLERGAVTIKDSTKQRVLEALGLVRSDPY